MSYRARSTGHQFLMLLLFLYTKPLFFGVLVLKLSSGSESLGSISQLQNYRFYPQKQCRSGLGVQNLHFSLFYFILKILFMNLREWAGGAEGGWRSRLPVSGEPHVGPDPRTPGSWPGMKADTQPTGPPRCPKRAILMRTVIWGGRGESMLSLAKYTCSSSYLPLKPYFHMKVVSNEHQRKPWR